MLVPFSYNLRSLFVRRSATILTVLGIGATVAVVAGILSLQQGFSSLLNDSGSDEVIVFLRPGSLSEGNSYFRRQHCLYLMKTYPEIAKDAEGQPLASIECYLAVRLFKTDGGETNVPIRGVQPKSYDVYGDRLEIIEGRAFTPGANEVVVGRRLADRIQNCRLGDEIVLNLTPFKVVGIQDSEGPFSSEIWGDLDPMLEALNRAGPNRVVARVAAGVDLDALQKKSDSDKTVQADISTQRAYRAAQTGPLTATLITLAGFLGMIMGIAAVFTATNTMLSALAARQREIGILLSIGFRPVPVFISFMIEAVLLGLLGGLVGCLLVLPLNGLETGTTNFSTFTEVAFAFRVTPTVLGTAVVFSMALGLVGGAWPALRAAMMKPTEALRRH